MASTSSKIDAKTLEEVKALLWGPNLKDDVFSRWTQGFNFSRDEPTALVQYEGGPCAILAPVQGFVLKNALFSETCINDLSQVSGDEANDLLVSALSEILAQSSNGKYILLSFEDVGQNSETEDSEQSAEGEIENAETGESSKKKLKLDPELFHARLRSTEREDEEWMKTYVKERIADYRKSFGVLLYLYSIVLTKGIEQIKNEVEDPGEPLIDGIHGHGSQSLINLLLTGKAVSNVWDNDKEVSGLKLQGIHRQASVGFLTLMEHLRYCEVGWYLKNPKYPIWLLGSETHLTILFSKEKGLVVTESQEWNARQMFQHFDPEGNGFISTSSLQDLMSMLDLVSEKEYVDIMKTKLDGENLGIITISSFMEEFYPGEVTGEMPRTFQLYHYNGLARSCPDCKVKYQEAKVEIREELEVQIITDTSPIKMCLQTKWPTIELEWISQTIASLN